MKNITTLLQKGNFTPKERVMLVIANIISQDKGDKPILSEAEKNAITDSWRPETSDEAREFNLYTEGWKLICHIELDAVNCFNSANVAYQRARYILKDFHLYPYLRYIMKRLNEIKVVSSIDEVLKEKQKQRDYKFNTDTLYRQLDTNDIETGIKDQIALELLDDASKQNLFYAELKDIRENETSYLCDIDDRLKLSELYKAKDYETIAEIVSKQIVNSWTKEYFIFGKLDIIKTYDIAERYTKDNNIPFKRSDEGDYKLKFDDDGEIISESDTLLKIILDHARETKTTPEAIIKETCLKMLKEGLLDDYEIITDETLKKWAEAKEKANKILDDLIDKGELVIDKTGQTGQDETGQDKPRCLTGESLYNCKAGYKFITDFRKWADDYDTNYERFGKWGDILITDRITKDGDSFNLSLIKDMLKTISIIDETEQDGQEVIDIKGGAKHNFKEALLELKERLEKGYKNLIGFSDLYKRISNLYELDLNYKITGIINDTKGFINDYNNSIKDALLPPFARKKTKPDLILKDKQLLIDTDKLKYNKAIVEPYYKEFKRIFGEAF
jgi:hypothetical protein